MQYPRRTSEFQEGTRSETKRNSRSTQMRQSRLTRPTSMDRLTSAIPTPAKRGGRITPQKPTQMSDAPGTNNKLNARTSRPVRPNSLERQTLAVPSSALRGNRTTPQKTPISTTKTSRVLFSTEKQRNIHNDKKWVQEKAQQIVDHLRETATTGAVHGLPYDFFTRSGCLRQMSTKQFVGIVNHFLHYIWGTRFTVGTNYVDDIIDILQKLQYPYQVNKSWLKTPNTSHSFGYVIQLFDFLMDFVPPQNEEQAAAKMKFEFEDPNELSSSSLMQGAPDTEFIAVLLENCEEGFKLWDKQLDDDFAKLKQETCDVLIFKRCGLDGIAALDKELQQLREELSAAQEKRPHINKEDEELCQRLNNEYKELQEQIEQVRQTLEITNKQLSELQAERQLCKHEFMQLVEKIEQMQNIISNQEMSAEQRDSCIAELEQRKHAFQIMERTLRELEGRQHHQQVLLSRHKKQLNDQIAIYNDYMYKIATSCTKMQFDTADLLLPLNPQEIEVKERIKRLEEIYARAQIQLQEMQQQLEQLENQVQELNHYIKSTLKVKNSELEMALKLSERKISEFEKLKQQQIAALDTQMLEVEGRLQQLEFDLKSARDEKRERRKQELDLEKQNDELMNCAEQEYNAAADEREALQNIFEKELERSNEILVEFSKLVEEREVELKALQEELTNNV